MGKFLAQPQGLIFRGIPTQWRNLQPFQERACQKTLPLNWGTRLLEYELVDYLWASYVSSAPLNKLLVISLACSFIHVLPGLPYLHLTIRVFNFGTEESEWLSGILFRKWLFFLYPNNLKVFYWKVYSAIINSASLPLLSSFQKYCKKWSSVILLCN